MTHAQLVILFVTDSCFFDLLLHVFFSRGSVTTGILKQKTLSLTAAVCMTVLRRWTWSLPLAGLQSFQACTGHWSAVYGPVLQSTNGVVEVERWHAAEGTGGGNCFPSICRPRVTLAICSSRNALYSLNTCQRVLLFACTLYTHDGGMRVIQYCNNIVFYIHVISSINSFFSSLKCC